MSRAVGLSLLYRCRRRFWGRRGRNRESHKYRFLSGLQRSTSLLVIEVLDNTSLSGRLIRPRLRRVGRAAALPRCVSGGQPSDLLS